MVSATWNAPAEAFNNNKQQLMQGKSSSDLLLNITSNYRFCGCNIVPEYNCFDIFKNGDIAKDLINYPAHLTKIFNL
jgi:modulator of drug activity B